MQVQLFRPIVYHALAWYAVAVSLAVILWLELPRWEPAWVLRTTPFVMLAARAAVADGDAQGFAARVATWGADAVPGLCHCLRHQQICVRRLAAQVIAAIPGELDARLVAALKADLDDDDRAVRRAAHLALHRYARAAPQGAATATGAAGAAGTLDAALRPAFLLPASATAAKSVDDDDDDDDDDMAAPAPGGKPAAGRR